MIPVVAKPEPAGFDSSVRQPGIAWLAGRGLPAAGPLPKGAKPHAYWRKCLDDLHSLYDGICAYLGVYIERATGAASADHFAPKSKLAEAIYEWDNYRLCCLAMNAKKNNFGDVLDPIGLLSDTFHIELVSGRIHVNTTIVGQYKIDAEKTIRRLHLDSKINRDLRTRYFNDYIELSNSDQKLADDRLKRDFPFLFVELKRQGI